MKDFQTRILIIDPSDIVSAICKMSHCVINFNKKYHDIYKFMNEFVDKIEGITSRSTNEPTYYLAIRAIFTPGKKKAELVALSYMTVVLCIEKVITQKEVVRCKSCNAFKNNPIKCSWLALMMAKLINMKYPYLTA